jgi:hypothetical protein
MTNTNQIIFISYASEDQQKVLPFYEGLTSMGLNVWMDCKNIELGQDCFGITCLK